MTDREDMRTPTCVQCGAPLDDLTGAAWTMRDHARPGAAP